MGYATLLLHDQVFAHDEEEKIGSVRGGIKINRLNQMHNQARA